MVNGKHIKSCLGDLYSVNWLQDSGTAAGLQRTLHAQFEIVKEKTNKSHVMEYGTQSFAATDTVDEYQGHANKPASDRTLKNNSSDDLGSIARIDCLGMPINPAQLMENIVRFVELARFGRKRPYKAGKVV